MGFALCDMGGEVYRIGHLGDMNALTLAGACAGMQMAQVDAGAAETFSRVVDVAVPRGPVGGHS